MFEGYGPASGLMSFPAAIILEGAPAQCRHRAYVAFRFGKVQPSRLSARRAAASCSVRHAS